MMDSTADDEASSETAPRPRILILTSHTGGGHLNLAQSLKERLGTRYDVQVAEPYTELMHNYYAVLSRHFLWFWDFQYTITDNKLMRFLLHSWLTLLVHNRVAALVERINPQLIISTHALLSYEVSWTNRHTGKRIPLVFQLTDLGQVHTAWFTEKHADAYLAPTREIYTQALRYGINKPCLHITGRPVRRQFLDVSLDARVVTLSALGLKPDVFTIFLQGGAKGSAYIDRTVKSILTADVPMQIILAVGNNTMLAADFAGIEHLHVLPFTETIAPYMAASDLIVGKAGASFLTEAFMLAKPFVVTTFIPGQEASNLSFLMRHNLGWVCLEAGALKQLLTAIASDPTMMAEKVVSIQAYREWNMQANQQLYPVIEGLLAE